MTWQVATRKVNKSKLWKKKKGGGVCVEVPAGSQAQYHSCQSLEPNTSSTCFSSLHLRSQVSALGRGLSLTTHQHLCMPLGGYRAWEGWGHLQSEGDSSECPRQSCSSLLGDRRSVKRLGPPLPRPFKLRGFLSNFFWLIWQRWKHIACLRYSARLAYFGNFLFSTTKSSETGVPIPTPSRQTFTKCQHGRLSWMTARLLGTSKKQHPHKTKRRNKFWF